MKVIVVGDIMLSDQPMKCGWGLYSTLNGCYETVFPKIRAHFDRADMVVGNLEGIIDRQLGKMTMDHVMKMPVSAAAALKSINVRALSLANNHTMEYGAQAFEQTCQCLLEYGIDVFGLASSPLLLKEDVGLFAFSGLCTDSTASRSPSPPMISQPWSRSRVGTKSPSSR